LSASEFWDDVVITSPKLTSIRDRATSLRDQFSRDKLAELAMTDFTSWGKESFDLGVKAYTEKVVGMPKGDNGVCADIHARPPCYLMATFQLQSPPLTDE
jgi:hypothetical protein